MRRRRRPVKPHYRRFHRVLALFAEHVLRWWRHMVILTDEMRGLEDQGQLQI